MEKYQFGPAELSLIESSPVPYAVYQFVDKRVVTLALSAGFLQMFELERDEAYELMDNDMYRDANPDDVARISDAAHHFATEDADYDVLYRSKIGGDYHIIHAHGAHVFAETGERLAYVWYSDDGPVAAEGSDFAQVLNQAIDNLLHRQSEHNRRFHDQLTGLSNRYTFYEAAEPERARLIQAGETPAFLFFNLNGMKHFNYKFGFAEGDKLLIAMSRVLTRHFGSSNCGRLGKDHFLAIAGAEDLEDVLQDIFDECESLNGGNSLPVRVGIYLDKGTGCEIGDACDRALLACHLNRVAYASEFRYFDDSMLEALESQRYFAENIDRAIEQGWIQVYYQAIVRSANGKVCDEEALSRWIDPERGLISPAEFIPALENTQLIYKLDLFVVEQVLAKMKEQADAGLYVVPQSINLSRADFDVVDIVEEIRWRVDASGIPRGKLNIEITESTVGSDFEFMKAQIERLRELGFKVWMDDFGSGYSSLDVLQDIAFDMIKLDMRFLQGFDEGDGSKIILTELAKMAISLGIDTVAEGVETEEQAEFLKEIGCSRLQGFHYTKPVSLEEIVKRNAEGREIGFENPDEAEYFASIGKVNLYDMASIAQDDAQDLQRYFDTIPMAIYEISSGKFSVMRANKSYREYMRRTFGVEMSKLGVELPEPTPDEPGAPFMATMKECSKHSRLMVVDEETGNGTQTHCLMRRIAVNPVTGTAALVVAVMEIISTR